MKINSALLTQPAFEAYLKRHRITGLAAAHADRRRRLLADGFAQQGKEAYLRGETRCPCPVNTPAAYRWHDGWTDAARREFKPLSRTP